MATDPFNDNVLELLIHSNQDYQREHGDYIVPLSILLLAARRERDEAQAAAENFEVEAVIARRERDEAREALRRLAYIAGHLFQMVDRETWRGTGGDDGQGHYEGECRAEALEREIRELAVLAAGYEEDGA